MQSFNLIDDKKIPHQPAMPYEAMPSAPASGARADGPRSGTAVKNAMQVEQPYYVAKLDENGFIEYTDDRKVSALYLKD